MYQRDRFDSQGKVFYSNVSHDIVAKENAILTEHTIGDIIYEDILVFLLRTSAFTKEMHKYEKKYLHRGVIHYTCFNRESISLQLTFDI